MFKFLKMLGAARDGDKMLKLYERALDAANRYVPIKLGPRKAKLASAILNEVLAEDVLKGNGVEEFHAQNRQLVYQKAKDLLERDLALREFLGHTMWVKWTLDKAFSRDVAVTALEAGWAYKQYAGDYGVLQVKQYDALVSDFEHRTAFELGKYLEAHSSSST